MEPELPGAASFCLEPEPTKVDRSRSLSRLRDLGHQEPEPPKTVAAPQHCSLGNERYAVAYRLRAGRLGELSFG